MTAKRYTANDIRREKLLIRPDGKPYTNSDSVARVLKRLGFKKKGMLANGIKTFALTKTDIEKANRSLQK